MNMQVTVDSERAAGRTLDLPRDRPTQHVPFEEIHACSDQRDEYGHAAEPMFRSFGHMNVALKVQWARLLQYVKVRLARGTRRSPAKHTLTPLTTSNDGT